MIHQRDLDSSFVEGFRPFLFDPTISMEKAELNLLLEDHSRVDSVIDFYHDQLKELIQCRTPQRKLDDDELAGAISEYKGGRDDDDCGIWVYYPWIRKIVHLLAKEPFIELRTNRNRNKITDEEQRALEGKIVGVVGLSVGRSVAVTIAQERIAGEIRLADFDTLELSNLNRIRTGLDNLGLNKAVSAAREIALIDPFLDVKVFDRGLQSDNIDEFFQEGGTLDLLIEECDSVEIKIQSRIKARSYGVPVVMDTSDRGMIDVERFDLEPERAIMHGWIDHLDLSQLKPGMSNEEKIPFLLPMLGASNMSPRMKASVLEMGHTLKTWPQLATSVNLGGAVTADITRRILLGEFNASGRWYVDTAHLISDKEVSIEHGQRVVAGSLSPSVVEDLVKQLPNKAVAPIPVQQADQIIEAGALAPSAGNMQPWHFHIRNGQIHLIHDKARSYSAFDVDHMIAHIGLGSCLENMILRAGALGIKLEFELFPLSDERLVASLYHGGTMNQDSTVLEGLIGERVTDRSIRKRTMLSKEAQHDLLDIEIYPETRSRFFGDEIRLSSIAKLCGEAEQLRALNRIGHEELFGHELRWNQEEVESTRDGLDIETLEIPDSAKAGLQMARDPKAIDLLRSWNKGDVFKMGAEQCVRNSHGVILVSAKGRFPESRIKAGMSAEKLWLNANKLGYSIHPVSAPIFLTSHNELQGGKNLSEAEQDTLNRIQKDLKRLFDLPPEEYPVFLMRVSPGGQPSKRSLRRPISEMMSSSKLAIKSND